MNVLRNFYDYMIRETWLILTGREEQATTEANEKAEADVEVERETARARPKFQRYFAEIERWKKSFDELMMKMEQEGAHRKVAYIWRDFIELPPVPGMPHPFGYPFDHDVAHELYVKTQTWRTERIDQTKTRVGVGLGLGGSQR